MPTWPYNDEHISDRSAIERCRTSRNGLFQAYIDAIPEMGAILSECAEVGWKATTKSCCACLMEGLGGTPEDIGRNIALAARIDDAQSFEGGDEHYLLLPCGNLSKRVLKWTYGDNFGLQLKVFEHDPELMNHHVISSGNPDPVKYLRRWIILNNIGPPVTRLEGILPPDFLRNERLPRLAISQRELPPENPTHQEIVKGFREIGFIEVSEHSYYRKDDNILLGDAAPRNIRFENGTLVPFDAVAEHPEGTAMEWCMDRFEHLV
jgi:hypothetical protein